MASRATCSPRRCADIPGSVAHGPEKLIKLPIRMLAIIIYDDEMARLVI
jgi:hypothetical protein